MLTTICSSITPRTTLRWTPQSFRSFSHSCFQRQASSGGQSPSRAFYQKLKTYPELYKVFRAAKFRVNKEVWAKIRAEPELLRARQEELRYHNNKLRSTNVEVRSKIETRAAAHFNAHKEEEINIRTRSIYRWCFGRVDEWAAWAREELPWKTHRPFQQHEKTYHSYACCGMQRYMKSAVSISTSHHWCFHPLQTEGVLTTYLISGNQNQIRASFFATNITQSAAGT